MNAESPPDSWTVAQAKARLSEVIEKARRHGPQSITRNGKKAVVVVDAAAWERAQKRKREGNFLCADRASKSLELTTGSETLDCDVSARYECDIGGDQATSKSRCHGLAQLRGRR